MAQPAFKTAVFIERDGILNTIPASKKPGKILPQKFQDFHVITEIATPLRQLIKAGFLLFVTTHQPGISKGTLRIEELNRMNRVLMKGFQVSEVLYCPHDTDDGCLCKKPLPGLVQDAQRRFNLYLHGSFVISDDWRDEKVARTTGCRPIIIRSPYNGRDGLIPDISKVNDLAAAVEKILRIQREQR